MALEQKVRYHRHADGTLVMEGGEPKPHLNEDGTVHYLNSWTPLDGEDSIHVVQTGPARGVVVMNDGTEYDLNPAHVQVSQDHQSEVHYHIAKKHEAEGTLTPIVHGSDWAGTPATVEGDHTDFRIVPGS